MLNIQQKYNFYFLKRGDLIFISHLDLMRLYARVLKKSGLPVVYTQGFNPHLELSIPFPLGVGQIGLNEPGEFYLSGAELPDLEEIKSRINEFLPPDIRIHKVEKAESREALTNLAQAFAYKIIFRKDNFREKLEKLLTQDHLIIERENKKGALVSQDIKEYLESWNIVGQEFVFSLLVKNQQSINIDRLLERLGIDLDEIEDIIRTGIIFSTASAGQNKIAPMQKIS